MLKHRVQTIPAPSGSAGNTHYTSVEQSQHPGTSTNPDIQIHAPLGAHSYHGDAINAQTTSGIQRSNSGNNINQVINDVGYRSIPNQQISPNISPSNSSTNMDCMTTSGRQPSRSSSQELLQPSCEAKEGIRILSERYDSLNRLSASPLGSPSSDGGTFSFADMIMSQKYREGVNEQDLLQVDTFYRSHKSEVHVCGCLVNMYFGTSKSALDNDQWVFSKTGIPLLLLDTGEHHRERKLFIILAEKGTGFTIWRDVIDNHTGYRTPNANFHTMRTSKDNTKLVGLSFDDAGAASEFYGHLHKLTADPNDELLNSGNNIKKKKSVKEKKKKVKLPKKTEISQPCCFVHVTKLDRPLTDDTDTTSDNKSLNPNEISAPFNFQHVTGPTGSGSDVANLMGSKLTLTSTSSVDSGLSDDRSSSKTGN